VLVRSQMKIHDALIVELIKPDRHGEATGDIIKIVGSSKIKYQLEELVYRRGQLTNQKIHYLNVMDQVWHSMSPDIIVTRLRPTSEERAKVVIEVETDVDFDFGKSLRQIKNYNKEFFDVRVIIPAGKEYEMFAPLYKNEGFRVWFWQAVRVWQCLRCGNVTEKAGPIQPKCNKCKKYTEHRLIELKDVKFDEFV